MCGLNALFCTTLQVAVVNGQIVDLLHGAGNHHEFVYGMSATFPTRSMEYLVNKGVTTAEEYRTLAVAERIRSLTQSYAHYTRREDEDYIDGKTDKLVPDSFMSQGLWERYVVPNLNTLRHKRALRAFGEKDRLAALAMLDARSDAPAIAAAVTHNFKTWGHELTEAEKAFVRGYCPSLTVGHGEVSKAFGLMIVDRRLGALLASFTAGLHQLDERPEFAVFKNLFPAEWGEVEKGLGEFNTISKGLSKRRHRRNAFQTWVSRRARAFAEAARLNHEVLVEAVFYALVAQQQPAVSEASVEFKQAA